MEKINKNLVPAHEIRSEIKVNKSRFISTLAHAPSVEAARGLITRVQKDFPDASHHIPAFIIGHGASQVAHCSDAGEPSGSAGRPALLFFREVDWGTWLWWSPGIMEVPILGLVALCELTELQ